MKQLSIKGLADFMTAGFQRQRTILRQFKYPDEDEARAKILYYREARDRIRAFHNGSHPATWLAAQANLLEALAAESSGRTRRRLAHNGRALHAYATHFGTKEYELLDEVVLSLEVEDVRVTAVPDLHVREKDQEKIIKLDFGTNAPDNRVIRIMSQMLFEAAEHARMGLPSAAVLYCDVTRGRVHRGARVGAQMRREINAACKSISALWDSL